MGEDIILTANPMSISGNNTQHAIKLPVDAKGEFSKFKSGELYLYILVTAGTLKVNTEGVVGDDSPVHTAEEDSAKIFVTSSKRPTVCFVEFGASSSAIIQILK
jgi:hypothetical protein